MKQVVIDRKHWGTTVLRSTTKSHKQCCLGFTCLAYGLSTDQIEGYAMPAGLPEEIQAKLPKWLQFGKGGQSQDSTSAALINDSSLTWAEKEKRLKPLFKKHRIQLVFRGKR